MECNNCGYICQCDTDFCDSCGYDLEHSYYNRQNSGPTKRPRGHSYNNYHPSCNRITHPIIWALIFGIAGLIIGILSFMYVWFLHFLGLGFGIVALFWARKAAWENAQLSTAATIIGLISAAMSILGIFVIACTCAMACEILDCGR